ncbi:radical SAM/SPASM domain-containing protein [Polyangium sorediatum]|uniref:radical SAM/SPASM domain-containing protein n=1 Tax=Polyangium sorediatum TaxID=889274 RepID=UPI002547916C|nr:radical SAM protein [Polyangium sorediatum]
MNPLREADGFEPPVPTPLLTPRTVLVRNRSLPVAPLADPPRRHLPLAGPSRGVDQAWRPIYVIWEITLRCDLACHHCGSRAGRARPEELSTEEALDLVRQMRDLEVTEITLIGGEAYLRDDWDVIARAIVDAGMICTITTGGRGFSAERARRAKAAGVRSVSVSIDGLAATHDMLRGVKGSHASAMEALRNTKEAGLVVNANTQIGRLNLAEVPAVFEGLIAAGVDTWQVQITVAMGRAADQPEVLLEPWQMLEVMPMLAALKERGDRHGLRIWPANNIGYFGPYEHVLRGSFPMGYNGSCGAGRTLLGVEANGDLKGCPSLPSQAYVGGNIRERSLREVWEQTDALRFTRDRTVDELWGHCRDCYYADACKAGCSWTAHVLFGRRGNNPFCHHRSLELLREGRRERLVPAEAASGKPFDHGRFELIEEDWPAHELDDARRRYGLAPVVP